jgi:hypothetical protein
MMAIDNLKGIWKNQAESNIQFSESDIYKMIHKKSTSIVKWIFYIGIIEFLVLTLIIPIFLDVSDDIDKFNLSSFYTYSTFLGYAIGIVFIYLFYRNYKNICVQDSTKKLMKDILKTRQTVNYYIGIQLFIGLVVTVVMLIKSSSSLSILNDLDTGAKVGVWVVFTLIIIAFLGLIWLFYRLIYGILINRLKENYKELKRQE